MVSQFREFLLKTNALALAIGVIIGTALGTVVTSLVNDIIMPPIGVLLGGVLKPVVQRFGKQLAERALDPDGGTFAEALKRARERQNGAKRNGSHPPGGNDTAPL